MNLKETLSMPAGPVIANNTPLSALWAIDRLPILFALYREIWIPEAVRDEFLAVHTMLRSNMLDDAPWIRVVPLRNPRQVRVYSGLDRGEAEVLALAVENEARLVSVDEKRGRRYARRLGLPVTGTIGVLLLAREKGLIASVRHELQALLDVGFYIDAELFRRALALAGEA